MLSPGPAQTSLIGNEFSLTTILRDGAIWQVSDKIAVDIALRDARVNGHTVNELRAGVTFGLPLW